MTMSYIVLSSRMKDVLTVDLDESAKRELADLAQQEGVAIGAVAERALRTGLIVLRSALNKEMHRDPSGPPADQVEKS